MGKIINSKEAELLKFSSKVIHVGGYPDPETGAVMPPLYQTSTYAQESPGKHKGYEYSRSHNPTRTRLEECLASIEQAKYALTTSSGLSMTMLIIHTLPHNSLIICGNDTYGGTYRIFNNVFHNTHRFIFTDTTDTAHVQKLIKEQKPKMLWLETPSNPLLKISDIEELSFCAKKYDCLTVVDSTMISPFFQNPLKRGADIAFHSSSKYLNGHSDVIGGAAMLNSQELYDKLWYLQNSIGPTPSPFDSWLLLRGLKTLSIRMERHSTNAMEIATFLEQHPKVAKVLYPGLPSHPQHKLAKKQMSGFGGMITCHIKGDLQTSVNFVSSLKLFTLAESLGGVESLIEHPAAMTHSSIPKEVREKNGISDGLVRISVGIEDPEDLIEDIRQTLLVS